MLSVSLLVLALPFVGLGVLRIMESFLHRQTEAKLIAEAAYVQLIYLKAVRQIDPTDVPVFAKPMPHWPPPKDEVFHPFFPQIDLLKDEVLPPIWESSPATSEIHPAAKLAGAAIEPLIKEVQTQNLSGIRLLDPNGVVVASTGGEQGADLSDRRPIKQALDGYYASAVRRRPNIPAQQGIFNRRGRYRVSVAVPILVQQRYLAGVVYLNRTSLSFILDVWRTPYTVTLIVLFAVTILIGLILASVITRPLKNLVDKARSISEGRGDVSLAVSKVAPREAYELSAALTAMVETLEKRLDYVQEFTRSVSHEFKTPLTSIRGSIELLQEGMTEMTEQERGEFLDIVHADVLRMNRLVVRLTELARIELRRPDSSQTDLRGCLTGIVAGYRESGQAVEIQIDSLCGRRIEVEMAPDLVETLFVNLIDNGLRHGDNSGVRVEITPGPTIAVINKGPAISTANQSRIFDRFFTTARAAGGTGLGLSIVRAIAQAHQARLDVTSNDRVTVFTLGFR